MQTLLRSPMSHRWVNNRLVWMAYADSAEESYKSALLAVSHSMPGVFGWIQVSCTHYKGAVPVTKEIYLPEINWKPRVAVAWSLCCVPLLFMLWYPLLIGSCPSLPAKPWAAQGADSLPFQSRSQWGSQTDPCAGSSREPGQQRLDVSTFVCTRWWQ